MKRMEQIEGKGCMGHKCSLLTPPGRWKRRCGRMLCERWLCPMVDASFDMDMPEETQKLLATVLTQKMCVPS